MECYSEKEEHTADKCNNTIKCQTQPTNERNQIQKNPYCMILLI